MIKIENLTKQFKNLKAVDNVSLEIKEKEIFGLLGPDGAGKTTLIRLITGILTKTSGKILIMGDESIEKAKPYLGYIPQRFSLYKDLTVMENILFIGSLYNTEEKLIQERAEKLLKLTNLWEFKDRLSEYLSGGMKQKLALATGLMHKPKLFILDEPTTGVDPISRREFYRILYQLNEDDDMTIIVATPYMEEAELCHRVAFMNEGKLIACKRPQAFIDEYPNEIIELSLDKKNVTKELLKYPFLDVHAFGEKYHLVVKDTLNETELISNFLKENGFTKFQLKKISPSLEDVFIAFSNKGGN